LYAIFFGMKFIIAILIVGSISCNQTHSKPDTKILDFGLFTIETPQAWAKIEEKGIDSYPGRIAIDSKDTLDFDLGLYSNNLYEYDPQILDSSMMKNIDTSRIQIDDLIFVKDRRFIDPDNYRKNNISWDTINGHKAKFVYPRKAGIGTTGVYIDSLWHSNIGLIKFSLSGNNLNPSNQEKVLQVLRTLKFHKR
jgi:hypothetical protein